MWGKVLIKIHSHAASRCSKLHASSTCLSSRRKSAAMSSIFSPPWIRQAIASVVIFVPPRIGRPKECAGSTITALSFPSGKKRLASFVVESKSNRAQNGSSTEENAVCPPESISSSAASSSSFSKLRPSVKSPRKANGCRVSNRCESSIRALRKQAMLIPCARSCAMLKISMSVRNPNVRSFPSPRFGSAPAGKCLSCEPSEKDPATQARSLANGSPRRRAASGSVYAPSARFEWSI